MDKYEGRRITINYLAVAELCKAEGIPDNAPNSAIAAAIEKMIFQGGISSMQPIQQPKLEPQTNRAGIAAMINQVKTKST